MRNPIIHIQKCLIPLLVMVMVFVGFVGCTKEITGNEFLLKTQTYVNDLHDFADGMDQVYTLYFTGKISDDDFINEVSELKDIYNYMVNKYDKFKEDNPIKAASHSYVSKRGINALDKIANAYKKVLDESVTDDNKVLDKENLSYDYMLCGEDVTASYAEYQTAIAWLKDAQKTTKSK